MTVPLEESLRVLLDHSQPMEAREAAARQIETLGDTPAYAILIGIIQGPWEREDRDYLHFRRLVVTTCRALQEHDGVDGPTISYPPPHLPGWEVEAPTPDGKMLRGTLSTGTVGTSMFDFHLEYPIQPSNRDYVQGFRKDTISVIEPDGTATRLPDWCRQQNLIVVCAACGADITQQAEKSRTACRLQRFMWMGVLRSLEDDRKKLEEQIREVEASSSKGEEATLKLAHLKKKLRDCEKETREARDVIQQWSDAHPSAK